VTDAQGRTTSFSHDANGRVREIGRPDQSKVRFDYDANGNMTVLVNPSGVAHTFGYNKVNHKSAYTTPLSGSYIYKYDKDRRPTETVFPSGRVVRNVYDKGRLARTETPEGNVYYSYLCGSKVGSVSKDGEGITYAYDGSLLTSETLSGSLNQTLSYSYDNDFARVQAVYAGAATGYGYDKDGLLTQAGAFAISRDAGNGLPVTVADGRLRRACKPGGGRERQGGVILEPFARCHRPDYTPQRVCRRSFCSLRLPLRRERPSFESLKRQRCSRGVRLRRERHAHLRDEHPAGYSQPQLPILR
jgi:YD repeat-containing protein